MATVGNKAELHIPLWCDMRQLTIGYPTTCYGTRRVSHGLPVADYGINYRSVRRLPLHRLPWAPSYWNHACWFLTKPAVDAVHLWSRVCMTDVPWMASFEMEFPRYFGRVDPTAYDYAYGRMADDQCRLLLPMSQAARQHFLSRVPDRYLDRIEPKVQVFTGGVHVPAGALQAHHDYTRDKRPFFRLGFVGRSFYRKGGPALVRAAKTLRQRGYDVRLLVISDVSNASTYVASVPESIQNDISRELEVASWIELHPSLPNTEVFQKLSQCDAFAFPTLDESLGWAVLEALGIGLPVILSNIFALPELVRDGMEGRLIPLPLDRDRRWTGIRGLTPSTNHTYADALAALTVGLVGAVEDLIREPQTCREMGLAARRRFLEEYDESVAARRLAAFLPDVVQPTPRARCGITQ